MEGLRVVGGRGWLAGRSSLSVFSPVNRRKCKAERKRGDMQVMQMMVGEENGG